MDTGQLKASLSELGLHFEECRRVLVVDDDPEVRTVLGVLLSERWDVETAEDGPTALRMLDEAGGTDLVIADQRMPKMTGVEMLELVAEQHPSAARMVLTAYMDVQPIVDAVNRGAVSQFLLKPWDPVHLRTVVAELLELKSSRSALAVLVDALRHRRDELAETLAEIGRTQQQLVSMERMATLGWLTGNLFDELSALFMLMKNLISTVETRTSDADVVAATRDTARALGTLMLQVKDIHTLASGKHIPVSPIPVDTVTFLEDLVEAFGKEEIGARRLVQANAEIGARLLVLDFSQVGQALLAMLRNAARASPPSAPIHLRVYLDRRQRPCFEVADSGRGMEQEELEHATEPFFSGFDPPGLGMGLAIAKHIAERHNGHLEVDSQRGRGTVARLYLSANQAWDAPL